MGKKKNRTDRIIPDGAHHSGLMKDYGGMYNPDFCACKSTDAYDCWALRYYKHTAVSGMRVDEDGGPCECACHEEIAEEIAALKAADGEGE